MENSIVTVENVWAEDLFAWFSNHIYDSCGDGAAVIVCENFTEVYQWFTSWYLETYERDFHNGKTAFITDNSVNVNDGNENFIFTNDKNIALYYHDYTFIVVGDCIFAQDRKDKKENRVIKAVKNRIATEAKL